MNSIYGGHPGALCLSRRVGEKLLIGDDIEVTVAKVHCGRVYLSVIAPKHVEIDREEVRVRKRASREQAATAQRPSESEVPDA